MKRIIVTASLLMSVAAVNCNAVAAEPTKVSECNQIRGASLADDLRGLEKMPTVPTAKRELFNGKDLTNWYTFLKGRGKNVDPNGVFSVKDGILRITGEEFGCLTTEDAFRDYKLTVEYRWLGTSYGTKKKNALDSGILFHSTGEDGGFNGIWMLSHEYNLIFGASGDFWTVGRKDRPDIFLKAEVGAEKLGGKYYIHAPGGREVTLIGNDRVCRFDIARDWTDTPQVKSAVNENPLGEWNTAMLVCSNDTVECWFNGKLVNRATHVSPSAGRIQLQSELCGIEFRRVTIEPLSDKTLVRLSHTGPGLAGRLHPTYASACNPATTKAKDVPEFLRSAVMYQLFTRMFTPEGTFESARLKLPELRNIGIDVIYLTPHQLADDDEDRRFWSGRQKSCGHDNAKNPYRQKDFSAVDPEYGTKEDLKRFVATAHELGMKVMFDLVYFHCGPNAVFLKEHPDFIVRNPDGTPKLGEWAFPEMDIANPAVREYLYGNMLGFLRDYDVDGFRCDVADMLPVSFWEEGARRCRAVKSDVFFMCEGLKGDDQISAFDLSYGFYTQWAMVEMMEGKSAADMLEKAWRCQQRDFPRGFHWMRCFENHDFANVNKGELRKEKRFGNAINAAMLATCFLLDGIPMIYNGQEIADASPHSIFSNRDHGGWHIDRLREGDAIARERISLVRRLARLRHEHPELFDAPVVWHSLGDASKCAYAFTRPLRDGKSVTLAVNVCGDAVTLSLPGNSFLTLPPHGFDLICK